MKKNMGYCTILLMVGCVLAGWFLSVGRATDRPLPPPSRVAIVDIVQTLNEYQRTIEFNDRLNNEQLELQNQRKQKIDRVETLQAQLESLHPDSKDYYQRQRELLEVSIDLKNFTEIKTEDLKRELRVHTEDIYNEMLVAVSEVAREMGYDMVLYRDDAEIQASSFPELLESIRDRKVLYASPQIDITQNVLDTLNQRHALRKSQ